MPSLTTIDAHAGGGPLRLIVSGFPSPSGLTMADKARWLADEADDFRAMAVAPPRGHIDLLAAVLTEAVAPGSHAGVVFMHNAGYAPFSGHGIVAALTIALERGLLLPGDPGDVVRVDTTAGTVSAHVSFDAADAHGAATGPRVRAVSVSNVPSFVLQGGATVKAGGRTIPVDVAYGGAFVALVDSEAAGVGLIASQLPEMRRIGVAIRDALNGRLSIVHPEDPGQHGVYATVFTGPSHDGSADLRIATVFGDGQIDPSPGGMGSCAALAVLSAMGVAPIERPLVTEGLLGLTFETTVAGPARAGDVDAVRCEVAGSAWITGEHTLLGHHADPLAFG